MENLEKYEYDEWKKTPNEKWSKLVRCTKLGSGCCNFCYKHDTNLYSFKCNNCDDCFDSYHEKCFLEYHDSMYCLECDTRWVGICYAICHPTAL